MKFSIGAEAVDFRLTRLKEDVSPIAGEGASMRLGGRLHPTPRIDRGVKHRGVEDHRLDISQLSGLSTGCARPSLRSSVDLHRTGESLMLHHPPVCLYPNRGRSRRPATP
jgi:hypothetical protein